MVSPPDARARVRDYLHAEMAAARLAPGQKVNLPSVARALDLSVTPVREALTQLVYSGILEALPPRGFFVPALSVADARVCYHAVAALETEALRLALPTQPRAPGTPLLRASVLRDLRRAAAVFAKAASPPARLAADAELHRLLTAPYHDTGLRHVLDDLKTRILFYEREFLGADELHGRSVDAHARLIDALAEGDVAAASAALRQNWLNVAAVLYDRIPDQNPSS